MIVACVTLWVIYKIRHFHPKTRLTGREYKIKNISWSRHSIELYETEIPAATVRCFVSGQSLSSIEYEAHVFSDETTLCLHIKAYKARYTSV